MTETEKSHDAPIFQIHILQNLTGVYLWLLFGYMSLYLNCDLQRMLRDNPPILHMFGFVTVFILFTNQAQEKTRLHPAMLFLRALTVYVVWILASKTKWYIIFTVLCILILYQMALLILDYIYHPSVSTPDDTSKKEGIKRKLALGVLITISGTIVIGVIDYMRLQRIEYREEFSLWKFFIERGICKDQALDYNALNAMNNKRVASSRR